MFTCSFFFFLLFILFLKATSGNFRVNFHSQERLFHFWSTGNYKIDWQIEQLLLVGLWLLFLGL